MADPDQHEYRPSKQMPNDQGKAEGALEQRNRLLKLLRQEPRGAANRQSSEVLRLIECLEKETPANLLSVGALQELEGVWELRWSSGKQPYLAVGPWLDNLQLLAPSQGRGMNLLRLAGPLSSALGIAVVAAINVEQHAGGADGTTSQRVTVKFQKGGWLGPALMNKRLQWLRDVNQSFPAWLDITVLDHDLRVCRGNGGTVFALLKRHDLDLNELMPQSGSHT